MLAAALCALSLLGACAAAVTQIESPTKPQNPQQTRIFVLRDPVVVSEVVLPEIKVDDQGIGELSSARYLFVDRPAGQHVVSVNFMHGHYPITLTTRPGSVHYVHLTDRSFVERFFLGGVVPQAIEQASTGHSGQFMLVDMGEPAGRALLQKLIGISNDPGPKVDPNPRT